MFNNKKVVYGSLMIAFPVFAFSSYLYLKRSRNYNVNNNLSPSNIKLISSRDQWQALNEDLFREITYFPVVGFDCEWVTRNKRTQPISLLQVSTLSGSCYLIRMQMFYDDCDSDLPSNFLNFMANKKILKVGVGVYEDLEKLRRDYKLICGGGVDLRHLVLRCQIPGMRGGGLKDLSKLILNYNLDKNPAIRCSDWRVEHLNDQQIHYAALDCLVSLRIFEEILKKSFHKNKNLKKNNSQIELENIKNNLTLYKQKKEEDEVKEKVEEENEKEKKKEKNIKIDFNKNKNDDSIEEKKIEKNKNEIENENETNQLKTINEDLNFSTPLPLPLSPSLSIEATPSSSSLGFDVISLCQGLIDIRFNNKLLMKKQMVSSSNKQLQSKGITKIPASSKAYKGRQGPLYHNSMLYSLSGQALCTCDVRKAQWYLDKGLAEKVSDNPLSVRLNFDPSGKPDEEKNYYLVIKENKCVVCGSEEGYIRKNVVPHEYRKHFPLIFKDHKSHDVILLCTSCHQLSNQYDFELKTRLALRYEAPIKSDKFLFSYNETKVKSASKALNNDLIKNKIPEKRRKELEEILLNFFPAHYSLSQMIQEGLKIDNKELNSEFEDHGQKVVRKIIEEKQAEGLIEFETLWRTHFLNTLRPSFLPPLWSVDHGHGKLRKLISQ